MTAYLVVHVISVRIMSSATLLVLMPSPAAYMLSFVVAVSEIRELMVGKDKVPNAVRAQQVRLSVWT